MTGLGMTLVRGALTSPFKRAGRTGATLPARREVLPASRVAPARLAAYDGICGFAASDVLPLTYPHVLGFPLAMRLMTARDFPLPVLGLVHTWIEITSHRAQRLTDDLELTVYAAGLRPHRRGTEVTVVTEARLADALVWESRSGYLSRHATSEDSPARSSTPLPELPAVAEWRLPADLGRRYGAASGDRNPIHLHPATAKLFGFPRHIAHGMWTLARCLAEHEGRSGSGAQSRIRSVRADFRAPVLLPSTVTYATDGTAFQLRGAGRTHLTGRVDEED